VPLLCSLLSGHFCMWCPLHNPNSKQILIDEFFVPANAKRWGNVRIVVYFAMPTSLRTCFPFSMASSMKAATALRDRLKPIFGAAPSRLR
jgi:hypothetical protein